METRLIGRQRFRGYFEALVMVRACSPLFHIMFPDRVFRLSLAAMTNGNGMLSVVMHRRSRQTAWRHTRFRARSLRSDHVLFS